MESIDTSVATVYCEDELIIIDVKEDAEIKNQEVDELFDAWMQLKKDNKKALILADISNMWEVSSKARKSAASKEKTKNIKGIAIVVGGPATKMVANFFINFNKPPVPVKLFDQRMQAKKWLLSL